MISIVGLSFCKIAWIFTAPDSVCRKIRKLSRFQKNSRKGRLIMPGLVLEGGTFRPVFSCGVMDALLDNDIMFDYVIGVSAGITYAAS